LVVKNAALKRDEEIEENKAKRPRRQKQQQWDRERERGGEEESGGHVAAEVEAKREQGYSACLLYFWRVGKNVFGQGAVVVRALSKSPE
jgi:hypothetical protein